jgi:hypothetical protein
MSYNPEIELVDAQPPPRKPNGLLIFGVLSMFLLVILTIACVLMSIGLLAAAPTIQNIFAKSVCQTHYPDLPVEQCNAWADDMSKSHSEDLDECQTFATDNGESDDIDPGKFFQCINDRGLGPEK